MGRGQIEALFAHLTRSPDQVAFRQGDAALTYRELEARARRYAAGLSQLGVRAGDRVASIQGTSLELVVAMLGHYLLGAVHVPVNTRYGPVEVEHILRDSGAKVALVDAGSRGQAVIEAVDAPALTQVVVVSGAAQTARHARFEALGDGARWDGAGAQDDEDTALFIYTSGTTGRSKGVQLSYRAVVSNIDALTQLWRWTPRDRLVLALPLFHVHGLCIGVHGTLLRGGEATLLERFKPEAVVSAIDAGGTIFMGVPTMYTRLVRALDAQPSWGETLKRARLFTAGSAALSAELFAAFERHTGHRILERYGMSETLLTLSNPYEPQARRPGTVGFAVPGCEVEVVDEQGAPCPAGEVGEIVVRGASLMSGYWNDPDKTAAAWRDGWFVTGDVASRDADGYVRIVGRRSVDVIKSGGYKISAREIEEVLASHPDVEEVAVVGLPDPEWGQRIAAALVPRPGATHTPEAWLEALDALAEASLASYKKPRAVIVLDALPRNALGKVQKHRIIDSMSGAAAD